jgi:hypothetical protein
MEEAFVQVLHRPLETTPAIRRNLVCAGRIIGLKKKGAESSVYPAPGHVCCNRTYLPATYSHPLVQSTRIPSCR